MDRSVLQALMNDVSAIIDRYVKDAPETRVHTIEIMYAPAAVDGPAECTCEIMETVVVTRKGNESESIAVVDTRPAPRSLFDDSDDDGSTFGPVNHELRAAMGRNFTRIAEQETMEEVAKETDEYEEAVRGYEQQEQDEQIRRINADYVDGIERTRRKNGLPGLTPEGRQILQDAANALLKNMK